MSKRDIEDFLKESKENFFPSDLIESYEPLERLANNEIGATYLIERKTDKALCIAKTYKNDDIKNSKTESDILNNLDFPGLPKFIESFDDGQTLYVIREYIKGVPLDERMKEKSFTEEESIRTGLKLCDILAYLHNQIPPIIHRDIKPSNIIIDDDRVTLIDFGISRKYDENIENDTVYLGTKKYAPPEQFGFSQTDNRTDIYAFGVLMSYLLTGSHDLKDLRASQANKKLIKIIEKCTAFSPKDRYPSIEVVKKALYSSLAESRKRKKILWSCGILLGILLIVFFTVETASKSEEEKGWNVETPAYESSEALIAESVAYMNEKYNTDMFSDSDEVIDMAYIKTVLVEVYGYDANYVNALPTGDSPPHEDPNFFLPWGFDDDEMVPRDVLIYVVVKAYWPDVVADWDSLKDDTGQYPGVRVAINFCEKYGITDNMNMYGHITKGDAAIVYAAAEKQYETMK